MWRQEDGIGGVDSGPAMSWLGVGKRVGTRAAGVVGDVGDGLRSVRVEADDDAGWRTIWTCGADGFWTGGRGASVIVGHGAANVTHRCKGKGVPLKQERAAAFKFGATGAATRSGGGGRLPRLPEGTGGVQ